MITPFTITQFWAAFLFVVTLISTSFASIQWTRVMEYHLPIPFPLAVLCTLAPVLNLFAQPTGHFYLKKYSDDYVGNAVKVFHLGIMGVGFLVFDVVLATLSAENIQYNPYSMDLNWQEMFTRKSLDIESIQKSLQCCGFISTKDRAYPFPGKNTSPTACIEKYGFTKPCSPALEKLARTVATTFFLVTLASILTKIVFSYVIVRFEILKAQFPQQVEDLFESNGGGRNVEGEDTGLISGRRHHRLYDGVGPESSGPGSLDESVE